VVFGRRGRPRRDAKEAVAMTGEHLMFGVHPDPLEARKVVGERVGVRWGSEPETGMHHRQEVIPGVEQGPRIVAQAHVAGGMARGQHRPQVEAGDVEALAIDEGAVRLRDNET